MFQMDDFSAMQGSWCSLKGWCCKRRVLIVLLFVRQNGVFCWTSHLQVVKRCWWKLDINAPSKNSVYIQLISFTVYFKMVQIRHFITAGVHVLCNYSWQHFVSHLQSPTWLGVIGTCTRWLFKNSCLWESNKIKAATGFPWEHFVISWTSSFDSQSNWIWSNVERPLNTVVGEWENHVALQKTENV